MNLQSLNERFKYARISLKLLQGDIYKATGIAQVKISNFETGRKKTPYSEYTDFLVSKGVSLDWLLYGTGDFKQKKAVASKKKEGNNDLESELRLLRLEREQLITIKEEQKEVISTQTKLIKSQSSMIKDFENRFGRMQSQMENLTNSLNNLMTMVLASGMQLLPKQQQIVGHQENFNIAGVSQVLDAVDLSNLTFYAKKNIGYKENRLFLAQKAAC